MDGKLVRPDSGGPGYEGVQAESPDPRYPDLLSRAQLEFTAEGIAYPWYTVIGARDLLVQGSFPPNDAARQTATGDQKIIDLVPERKAEVCDDPSILLDPEQTQAILAGEEAEVRTVTPDPNRRLLDRGGWMREFFSSPETPGPVGHGFAQGNLDDDTGYYTFEHGVLSFIVLDTVNSAGFAAGSLDKVQFTWLGRRLVRRSSRYYDADGNLVESEAADRLIVIVSHHPLDRLNNPLADSSGEQRVLGPELEALLHRFPNVIAHVTGHSQANRITPRPDPLRHGGSYWEIATTSPVAFPMEGRLLEVADNGDGTISLFSTVYDLAASIDPRDARDPTRDDDVNEEELASIARGLAAHDPQRDLEAAGLAASDRNAEMLVPAPFNLSAENGPLRYHVPPGRGRQVSRRDLWRLLAPRA
jgi:metallophosphoesterase (TIGR03767 family)